MSDTVLILGAGASAESGAPVMATFLDVARRLYRTAIRQPQSDFAHRESYRAVFDGIAELGSVYEKGKLDTDNLESVFAAFEMAKLFQRLGSLKGDQIDQLPDAMRTLIVDTLERTITFPIEGSSVESRRVAPPKAYADLVSMFRRERDNTTRDVSIITFNYDLGIDYALHVGGHRIDYCVKDAPDGGFPLMKLHGSLNWLECEQCGIAPYPLSEFFQKRRFDPLRLPSHAMQFRITPALQEDTFEHCNGALRQPRIPMVVPPTWNKGEHHQRIARVWAHAARHLSTARQVAIIGYSLPASDYFFRLLWSLGTVGPIRIERLLAINDQFAVQPNSLEERYRSMLGDVAEKRFEAFGRKFGEATKFLKTRLFADEAE